MTGLSGSPPHVTVVMRSGRFARARRQGGCDKSAGDGSNVHERRLVEGQGRRDKVIKKRPACPFLPFFIQPAADLADALGRRDFAGRDDPFLEQHCRARCAQRLQQRLRVVE